MAKTIPFKPIGFSSFAVETGAGHQPLVQSIRCIFLEPKLSATMLHTVFLNRGAKLVPSRFLVCRVSADDRQNNTIDPVRMAHSVEAKPCRFRFVHSRWQKRQCADCNVQWKRSAMLVDSAVERYHFHCRLVSGGRVHSG